MSARGELTVKDLNPYIGSEVSGIDLGQSVSPETRDHLLDLLHERKVLVFRDQRLTPGRQAEFSRMYGELEIHPLQEFCVAGHPEVLIISNIFRNGRKVGLYEGGQVDWHVDHGTSPRPSAMSFLYSVTSAQVGGDTLFCAADAAYDALPDEFRARIADAQAVHSMSFLLEQRRQADDEVQPDSIEERRSAMPDVVHPLVRSHPVTDRKALFVSSMTIRELRGMSPEEGRSICRQLLEHATQGTYVYRHQWRDGDLVWWDNRTAIHTATPCDRDQYHRLLHRTTVI
ncbi:TauD/TfdA dioxygenase family protein [Streptomyces sp. OE57]|uniref:TauD/TfdA dioxygenase family protein n=1 Tax=Streptomyces lacaronensis TaxID=3379885 RepID=UPI0039B77B91